MTGDRWAVAGVLLAGFLAALVAGGAAAAGPGLESLATGDPVQTLFQALVAGIITGVTLVLTVNQLVLSQELGSLSDQRERLRGAMEYREDADDYVGGGASPAEPAAYLRHLVEAIADRGRELSREADDGETSGPASEYAAAVVDRAETLVRRVAGRSFGSFGMLWAALRYDYSRQIQHGRSLLRDSELELGEGTRAAVEEIVRGLMLFGSVREHFKTLYFQRDLIDLSRAMLAVALPALVVAVLALLFFRPDPFPPRFLGVGRPLWIAGGAVAVSVAPFALLLSFILRIATVARRTLAAGPFVLDAGDGTGSAVDGPSETGVH